MFRDRLLIFWLGDIGAYLSVPVMLVTVLIFCRHYAQDFRPGLSRIRGRGDGATVGGARGGRPSDAKWITPASPPPRPEPVSEAEFKALLRVSEFQGQVEPQERALIHKVFDFGTRRVSEVMTPREKIHAIDIATPPDRLVRRSRRRPFLAHPDLSRQPR